MSDSEQPMPNFSALTGEEAAQLASGMGAAGLAWHAALQQDDTAAMWHGLDPELRLVIAQDFVWNNSPQLLADPRAGGLSRDELAGALAADPPQHPLWHSDGERVCMRWIRSAAAGLADVAVGQGSRPRPIAPELEVLALLALDDLDVDETGMHIWPPGREVRVFPLVMRQRDGRWLIRGIGHWLYHPGWPPTCDEIPDWNE